MVIVYFLGSFLGFIAGSVGIGGGIYLVPLIIMFGLGTTKEASAAEQCSFGLILLDFSQGYNQEPMILNL